ncbi:hypothetical protein BS47DRAFT_1369419 [Hydnum rufescens UP504]|uniref:Uncharacterized protein n=1 Tax=Hydnum rufescens UP504 TaxID=1448309 RepID=A0A9P6ADZ9_9AGAM|nr:hypothetical protein BS47DRAFT_1369419 [Hydnum rufescens UP504]
MAMGTLICTRACYVDSSFYPIGIDYSEDDPYLVQEMALPLCLKRAISSNMTVNLDQTLTLSNEFKLIPVEEFYPAHVEPLTRPSLLALLLSQDIHGSSEFLQIGMRTALFWRFAADEHTVTFTVLMYKSLPLHYSK